MNTKKQISEKRQVEDILDMGGPVAYVIDQKKKVHQAVCPWCAKDIGEPKHLKQGTNYLQLYQWLLEITLPHIQTTSCGDATEIQVQVEKNPNWKES